MKKLFLILILTILGFLISGTVGWFFRARVLSHLITQELKIPAAIGSIELFKGGSKIVDLWLGTPRHSHSKTSLLVETININASKKTLFSDPVTIEKIDFDNVFIGVEFYDSTGEKNNWTNLAGPRKAPPKKVHKDYLVKTLSIKHLVVEVTKPNGSVKRYPMIDEMTLNNISSTSGFPIREIERAILNQIIKDVFQKLNLDQLLKSIDPFQYTPGSSPWRLLPNLFGQNYQKVEISNIKL